jgi:tRNA(Ile)-lysidine synthase
MRKDAKEERLFVRGIAANIERHAMLEGVRRLGLAVSGGADSVALLHLMAPLCRRRGIAAVVLHLDHGLRGATSAADRDFVRGLAAAAGLSCASACARVARRPGLSLEMAAREARLDFFRRSAAAERLDAVATGHHADDVAETLLLRLARGAGATGLAGLRPVSVLRDGNGVCLRLIRPLLGLRRAELRAWLQRQGLAWREDASNRDTAIARNAVRRHLLPRMRKVWGDDFARLAARSAEILREEDDFLEHLAAEWLRARTREGAGLPLEELRTLPLALRRRVARAWLRAQGAAPATGFASVERMLDGVRRGAENWQTTLPGRLRLRRQGDLMLLAGDDGPPAAPEEEKDVAIPGETRWSGTLLTAAMAPGIVREHGKAGRLPAACSLEAAALAGRALRVRARRPGDRIAPLGMSGSRKVQDILVDARLPAAERDRLPLLTCGEELVWIPGYRVARAFAVRDPARPAVQLRVERLAAG